jgi:soluble lytic murein transglycosylase-like protein
MRRLASGRVLRPIVALGAVTVVTVAISACQPPDFAGSVPESYKSYFQVAAKRCPAVLTPHGLAAQASAESGFDPSAVSPAGAQGMMQIIPAVWSTYGTDADGDGRADPFTAADSVATAAKFNCYLAKELESMRGNQTELRLAAYNAGLGAVQRYQGIPPYRETEQYVDRVTARTKAFADDFETKS